MIELTIPAFSETVSDILKLPGKGSYWKRAARSAWQHPIWKGTPNGGVLGNPTGVMV